MNVPETPGFCLLLGFLSSLARNIRLWVSLMLSKHQEGLVASLQLQMLPGVQFLPGLGDILCSEHAHCSLSGKEVRWQLKSWQL